MPPFVISSGIKAASAVPVVAKDLIQQPLLTEMEKSSVKVCVQLSAEFIMQTRHQNLYSSCSFEMRRFHF